MLIVFVVVAIISQVGSVSAMINCTKSVAISLMYPHSGGLSEDIRREDA